MNNDKYFIDEDTGLAYRSDVLAWKEKYLIDEYEGFIYYSDAFAWLAEIDPNLMSAFSACKELGIVPKDVCQLANALYFLKYHEYKEEEE